MTTHLLPTGTTWYRANLHCHTTVSDGHWSPERIKEEYIRAGYSIVAFPTTMSSSPMPISPTSDSSR